MKVVTVKLSPEAEEVYKKLNESAQTNKVDRSILNAINKKIELIKANFQYGEPISKDKIPQAYLEKYDITNLAWVRLPNFWRMLYSLEEGEQIIEIIAFVVDILDHKTYNKKFGYSS